MRRKCYTNKHLNAISRVDVLEKALRECEEYFEQRSDADSVGDPSRFFPNEEMKMLGVVKLALGDA